ncbi:hypothetical protein, partial [Stutzerimonas stutzeri]|uniref:hypothetical protein n=1 Tax=Stutzerimonas stutzeri TaxID=316 RepID=UPI001C8BDD9C
MMVGEALAAISDRQMATKVSGAARCPFTGYLCPQKKGSSRIAGKVILDLHEKEFAVPVTVG